MLTYVRWLALLSLLGCAPAKTQQISETRDPAAIGDAALPPGASVPGNEPARDGSPGSGTTPVGPDGGSRSDYVAACSSACITQANCVGVTAAQCRDQCDARAAALAKEGCTEPAKNEMTCLAGLSCTELQTYATAGRRSDARCGQVATAYFAACTLGRGEFPDPCVELCAREATCDPQTVSPAACEENCVLRATAADWDRGPACSAGFLSLASCVADASCNALVLLRDQGQIPEACTQLEATRAHSCE